MSNNLDAEIKELVSLILDDYKKGRDIDEMDIHGQPDRDEVRSVTRKLIHILFPGYYQEKIYKSNNNEFRLSILIEDTFYNLSKQIEVALRHRPDFTDEKEELLRPKADEITAEFFRRIPMIREYVDTDIQATYDGDPASYDKQDIIISYPGLLATTINRMAHELYLLEVPLIPRVMTEYAHSRTGIDIHPGATLGKYLMIDHGTGVVVGETSIIGDHVKIYQGVTIGALSTKGGQHLKGDKRHPTIEDNVTIYSNASLLGGETVIGHDSVIGGNCFITFSVAPETRVSIKNQELTLKGKQYQYGVDYFDYVI